MGKVLTLKRRGLFLVDRGPFYFDHSLALWKATVMWELLFSLFEVHWMIQGTIRKTCLGWYSSFVGRTWEIFWLAAL